MAALEATQSKIQSENSELSQQLAEAESKVSSLTKTKQQLESQLEDTKSELNSENSVCVYCIEWTMNIVNDTS